MVNGYASLQLDHDRKGSLVCYNDKNRARNTWLQRRQSNIWNFLHVPSSSTLAKIYGFVALMFILLSIFSFFFFFFFFFFVCFFFFFAETTSTFHDSATLGFNYIQRRNNVDPTSVQCLDVESTTNRRRPNAMRPLGGLAAAKIPIQHCMSTLYFSPLGNFVPSLWIPVSFL